MYPQIKQAIEKQLGSNFYYTLDDGEQSFVVYPINHLYLVNDGYCINVGHVIYENVTCYNEVITNLKLLVSACDDANNNTGEYIQVVYLEGQDQPWRAIFGGFDNEQQDFDFTTCSELLSKLRTFEFE